jgi:hypothetical protein
VTPYYLWHVWPICLFHTFKNFIYHFKHQGVGPLYVPIGLRVVYGCEGDLCSDLMAKILEQYAVEILGIINCDVLGNTITTDDILLEELFDSCGAYVCDRFCLNPLHEVLDCHDSEGVIVLCWGKLADYVNAPSLERLRWGD